MQEAQEISPSESAPTPLDIQEAKQFNEEIHADMIALDEAVAHEDITTTQRLLEIWRNKIITLKESATAKKATKFRKIARQEPLIQYSEHCVHTLLHASVTIKKLIIDKGTVSEKFSNLIALTADTISLLSHLPHLIHFVEHPTLEGYAGMQHFDMEGVFKENLAYRMSSFAEGVKIWGEQRKIYQELAGRTESI